MVHKVVMKSRYHMKILCSSYLARFSTGKLILMQIYKIYK